MCLECVFGFGLFLSLGNNVHFCCFRLFCVEFNGEFVIFCASKLKVKQIDLRGLCLFVIHRNVMSMCWNTHADWSWTHKMRENSIICIIITYTNRIWMKGGGEEIKSLVLTLICFLCISSSIYIHVFTSTSVTMSMCRSLTTYMPFSHAIATIVKYLCLLCCTLLSILFYRIFPSFDFNYFGVVFHFCLHCLSFVRFCLRFYFSAFRCSLCRFWFVRIVYAVIYWSK